LRQTSPAFDDAAHALRRDSDTDCPGAKLVCVTYFNCRLPIADCRLPNCELPICLKSPRVHVNRQLAIANRQFNTLPQPRSLATSKTAARCARHPTDTARTAVHVPLRRVPKIAA